MKQILLFFTLLLFCTVVFATECQDDEKFVPIKDNQIGYSMYNEALKTEKMEGLNGTEWKLRNKTSYDQNVIGHALCLDTEEFSENSNKTGPHCFCKIKEIDNYKVLSDWTNVEHYQNHVFDENKTYSSEMAKRMQKKNIEDQNKRDCMYNCPNTCQSKLYKLIKTVRGFYVCDKALYKISNVRCTIDNKFVKAKNILVFEDIAEINMGDSSILFTKSTENTQDLTYVGEFEYEPVFLKVQNNTIYVGRKTYSMEECL